MRTFHCEHCGNPVYFENDRCTRCQHELGVLPSVLRVSALRHEPDGSWRALTQMAAGAGYRKCRNYLEHRVCNWMVPVESNSEFCIACSLNQVIPNLSRAGYMKLWYRLERSKRRLIYSLLKLGLPLRGKADDPAQGLAFAFLSDRDAPEGTSVLTGHANGLITININEADPAIRERSRIDLDEKYRTLLGHFRHEIGHYYWDRLIRDKPKITAFRKLFGDERADYAVALDRYYREGPTANWQQGYISRYASSHPWEDWAETWAHYLHIVDTLETAVHFGVQVEREFPDGRLQRANPRFDAYRVRDFQEVIRHWMPLTQALNSLNRSMGLQDLYPFVLSAASIRKLAFVHSIVWAHRGFDVGYLEDKDVDRSDIQVHWLARIWQRLSGIDVRRT